MTTSPRSRRSILRLSLAAAGLLALACGGGGEEETGPPVTANPEEVLERAGMPGGDACELVTQSDAEQLFGVPAAREKGTASFSGNLVSQCLWSWDTEDSNQLLQFQIWRVASLSPPNDAEPFELGSQGFVRVNAMAGVDVEWLQGGLHYSLSYSTIGPEAPEAPEKEAEVEILAREVAKRVSAPGAP